MPTFISRALLRLFPAITDPVFPLSTLAEVRLLSRLPVDAHAGEVAA